MQTRSNFTGDLSLACSMRNFGRWLRTAVCSSIGMWTSPKEIAPVQRALGIRIPEKRSPTLVAVTGSLRLLLQVAFGFQPVVEVGSVVTPAIQIPLVRAHAHVLLAWLGTHGSRVASRAHVDAAPIGVWLVGGSRLARGRGRIGRHGCGLIGRESGFFCL